MLFFVLLIIGAAIFSLVAMALLLVLRLVLWVLGLAGKTTFRIAKFGFKLAGSAVVFIIALVLLLVLGIL